MGNGGDGGMQGRLVGIERGGERMQRGGDEEPEALAALVRAAQAGDTAAFRELVDATKRPVYALGYRMLGNHDDADDVAQETFVRAWSALERYDPRYSFLGWLRTIATRLALNVIDKRRRRRTEGGETFELAAEASAAPNPGPDAELEAREMGSVLEQALRELPEEFRRPLLLRTHEELSYAEIAKALAIPVGTVMSRLHRARTLLRQALEARGMQRSARRENA